MAGLLGALVALSDVIALLALPASVVLLVGSGGSAAPSAAPVAAIVATLATVLRAFLIGCALERATLDAYGALVRAATSRDPREAALVRETEEGSAQLMHAVSQVAAARSIVRPHLVATSAALLGVAAWSAHRLGWRPVALGAGAALLMAPLFRLGAGRIRRAEERGYEALGHLARDLRVLLESPVELRAHGREEVFAERVVAAARGVASSERRATELRALGALLPASLALLALSREARAGALWLVEALHAERAAEATVLGGTGLLLGLALARGLESLGSSAPGRLRFGAFLARARSTIRAGGAAPPSLAGAPLVLDGCAFRWPGAHAETPAALELRVEARGLVVLGSNGAGKTTLSLLLLGVLAPTRGRVLWGVVDAADLEPGALAQRVAYLPQTPFVAATESVRWHLALLGGEPEGGAAEAALRTTGVWEVLAEHAARRGLGPLEVPMGELSGGERKRVLLARVLLAETAELVILDEPEASLDAEGRALVRSLAGTLAADKRVVLVAQDERVAPEGFARLVLRRA